MTTFKQEEYESFLLEGKKVVTDVKVTTETLNHPDMMTPKELENATAVFRSLETGLRGGTIDPEDLHKAMKRLGKKLTSPSPKSKPSPRSQIQNAFFRLRAVTPPTQPINRYLLEFPIAPEGQSQARPRH